MAPWRDAFRSVNIAKGLIDLWASGYIEPIISLSNPYHILAQQLMALALQENGIGRREWLDWIRNVPAFADMPAGRIDQVVAWMLEKEVLWDGTAAVRSESGEAVWWTFAGVKANATLACELSRTVKNRVTYDSFTVTSSRICHST